MKLYPLILFLYLVIVLSCASDPERPSEPNVSGVVSHALTLEPLENVPIDALTAASSGRWSLDSEAETDAAGYYELALPPGDFIIRVDLPSDEDCEADLTDALLEVDNNELYEVDFAFVPPPCE